MTKPKLAWKLAIGFGSVLMLLVAVMVVGRNAVDGATEGYADLLAVEAAIEGKMLSSATHIVQCRRNEKDFLLRRDTKHAKRNAARVQLLSDEIPCSGQRRRRRAHPGDPPLTSGRGR